MNRRTVLRGGLAAMGLMMAKPSGEMPPPEVADMSRGRLPFGTLEAHKGIGCLVDKVTLDGVEIENCMRANEIEGWADVYTDFPTIVRKTGRVVFIFGSRT